VPIAVSLCILKSGYLFVAAEKGNHHSYKLKSLGESDKFPVKTSSQNIQDPVPWFFARNLMNLELVEDWKSLSCIADMKIVDAMEEGNPQIYTLCAAGDRSSLRVLRHGLPVSEIAVSQLPGLNPLAIWTIKESNES
jgi:splicing factor 3B subunit 3